MASPRIPVAWLLLGCIVALFAFFAYHILNASANVEAAQNIQNAVMAAAKTMPQQLPHPAIAAGAATPPAMQQPPELMEEEMGAPAVPHPPAAPRPMPRIPGQTEADLRAKEPLQAPPPSVQYDAPDAMDPLNHGGIHMGSEFGSNLRHPEQAFEARPGMTLGSAVNAGLAGVYSSPNGHRATGYSPEMVQNGGLNEDGILAYEGGDGAYAML